MKKAVLAEISGRVQGVGYRYFALKQATQLGLTGYVKNRFNGSVEVFAQGESDLVEQFLRILEQGPHFAEVDILQREEAELTKDYDSFIIEY